EDDSRAVTTEPSGDDGTPVVVAEAQVGKLAHHIAPGFHVFTSEMEDVGTIKQYDRETGQMLVQHGPFGKRTFVVPVALAELVDRNERNVYLAVSLADLQRHPTVRSLKQKPEVEVVEADVTEA
ncbi:MAG: hypothetical protein JOZ41_02895, partial [Chloroflexi bacterium]|nr:hypothetical protein [Chloroflexota bacterium]